MTDEELWEQHYPGEKIPGSAEPMDDKCHSKLRSKHLKELGITRYCVKTKGMGTSHLGEGTCKWHLGNTGTHTRPATKALVKREYNSLAERFDEPVSMGPPEVEVWLMGQKFKSWMEFLEGRLEVLGNLDVTDKAGIEHTRAVVEMTERAWDRFNQMLQFMLKFDLRKRILELEEHQAQGVGGAFLDIILSPQMKLSEAQIEIARQMFAEKMTGLGAAMTPSWSIDVDDEDGIEDAEIVNG
jgi:hypothetical protein